VRLTIQAGSQCIVTSAANPAHVVISAARRWFFGCAVNVVVTDAAGNCVTRVKMSGDSVAVSSSG
jgi:hypothetical protein